MALRKELSSIASGIIGSFNSRNNDIDGYWGIGKLYKLVENLDSKVVSIELKSHSISPNTKSFTPMLRYYSNMLERLLISRGIPNNWVISAQIMAEFEAEYEHKYHFWRSGLGKPCSLKCDIHDDNGRHHIAFAYNNCRPHDPEKEFKSTRAHNF